MKIDTHQHYWRYHAESFPWIDERMPALRRDCLPGDCLPAMRAAGVTGAVAVQARTERTETDDLLALADQNPTVLGVVGWADLADDDLGGQLDRWCAHPRFKGLRHILQDEADVAGWIAAPARARGMRLLQSRQRVYDVLVFEHQLQDVRAFCARHDAHWLVLDHLGKPALRRWTDSGGDALNAWGLHLRALALLPHLMCKLSGAVTETDWTRPGGLQAPDVAHIHRAFDRALEAFGPDRLMFGSDWPVCQLAAPFEAVHGLAEQWAASRLSASEQQAFWSGNAMRCYGLDAASPSG